jgi:hypothetical protein
MNKQREALELALDALDSDNPDIMLRASISIREALAEPEPEPVAWMCPHDPERETAFAWRAGMCESSGCGHQRVPLYTAPPQRKPLTETEIRTIRCDMAGTLDVQYVAFARAIERAHGIGD